MSFLLKVDAKRASTRAWELSASIFLRQAGRHNIHPTG